MREVEERFSPEERRRVYLSQRPPPRPVSPGVAILIALDAAEKRRLRRALHRVIAVAALVLTVAVLVEAVTGAP